MCESVYSTVVLYCFDWGNRCTINWFAATVAGNSKNILKVLNTARKLNIKSLSFLGNNGGKSKGKANLEIIVPSTNTARIQECHIFLGHLIFSLVEKKLIK